VPGSQERFSRLRLPALRLLLATSSLLVFGIGAEIILRLTNPFDLDYGLVTHHPVRIETLSPNFRGQFKRMPVDTNQFGHRIAVSRPREYDAAKPPGVIRVAMYGDSFTFGDEWPIEDSFVEQLQQRLDPTFSRIQVLNFGVPGYNPYQTWDYMRETLPVFQPDVAIVQFNETNDLIPIQPVTGGRARRWQDVNPTSHLSCRSRCT
jgi:hypothetical protein